MTLQKRKNLSFLAILLSALIIIATAVAGNLLHEQAVQVNFSSVNLSPSAEHPFGTDRLGRDMLARTLAGLSTSVWIGTLTALTSAFISATMAGISVFMRKPADSIVTWMTDILMGIPHILLLILLSFSFGRGFVGVTLGLALSHWMSLSRILRAELLQIEQSEFILVPVKMGQNKLRVFLRHAIPHIAPQFTEGFILLFPHAVLHEAGISFLGFGLPAEQPAIGIILSESLSSILNGRWWLAVLPGVSLAVLVFLFDTIAKNIGAFFNPTERHR